MTDDAPRFRRFIYEFEVEVVDPLAVRTFVHPVGTDAEGNLGVMDFGSSGSEAPIALSMLLAEALQQQEKRSGLRFNGGSAFPRHGDGRMYAAVEMPPVPVRRDDGSYDDDPATDD